MHKAPRTWLQWKSKRKSVCHVWAKGEPSFLPKWTWQRDCFNPGFMAFMWFLDEDQSSLGTVDVNVRWQEAGGMRLRKMAVMCSKFSFHNNYQRIHWELSIGNYFIASPHSYTLMSLLSWTMFDKVVVSPKTQCKWLVSAVMDNCHDHLFWLAKPARANFFEDKWKHKFSRKTGVFFIKVNNETSCWFDTGLELPFSSKWSLRECKAFFVLSFLQGVWSLLLALAWLSYWLIRGH